jgi:hypothetical protein
VVVSPRNNCHHVAVSPHFKIAILFVGQSVGFSFATPAVRRIGTKMHYLPHCARIHGSVNQRGQMRGLVN